MKIKPLYIYLAVLAAAIIFLVVFTSDKKEETNPMTANGMPQDDIHKGLDPHNPSGANVSGEVKARMEELKKEYESSPQDTLKMKNYADFLAMAHKPDQAVPLYEKILQKDPKRTDVRFSLALIHYNKSDFRKAEDVINKVFDYDKKNVQAKYNLGAIAATKGDKEKAKQFWQELVKESPDSETGKMAQESLNALNQQSPH